MLILYNVQAHHTIYGILYQELFCEMPEKSMISSIFCQRQNDVLRKTHRELKIIASLFHPGIIFLAFQILMLQVFSLSGHIIKYHTSALKIHFDCLFCDISSATLIPSKENTRSNAGRTEKRPYKNLSTVWRFYDKAADKIGTSKENNKHLPDRKTKL